MHERETCVDCGAWSPTKPGELTLTSSMGWRLTKERGPDGRFEPVWRCGECWERYKARSKSSIDRHRSG